MNENEQEPLPEAGIPPEEAVPLHETSKEETTPVAAPAYVPIPPPSRFKRFLRSATRWGIVVLTAFLIGIIVMAYPLLRAQAALKNAQQERDQLKLALSVQNKLIANLQTDQARLVVLRALSELRAARIALSSNDEVNLPLFIDKAAQVMKAVPVTLLETQQATVTKIQQKLAQAQEQAKSNLQVTKSTLDPLLADTIENLRNLDAVLNPNP